MNDDAFYAKRCQSGETEAFGVLYDKYLDPIYRFIFYKTFSKEVAEDLTSDVFHKALEKIASFEASRGDFSTWLYRIARNRVIDYYRTKKVHEPIDDAFDMGVDERTPETLDAIRSLGQVTAYLETLDAKQREIIMLRVWEERSYREIAAIVGGTEDSVKMAFSRSIKAVREQCGPIAASILALASVLTTLPFYE